MISRKGHAITWTSFNKPQRIYHDAGYTEFRYDVFHRRFAKTDGTSSVAYIGNIFEEYKTGGSNWSVYRHYIYAGDKVVAVRNFGLLYDDDDGDGVSDELDNCTLKSNADQRDTNGDGFGNVCDPDLNNDDAVNFIDLSLFTQHFNSVQGGAGNYSEDADFNGDGAVNFLDLIVLQKFFTVSPPGPSYAAFDAFNTFYLHTNHQGTIETITDRMGELVHEQYYNEYGQYRRKDDWQLPAEDELDNLPQAGNFYITDRGFTGHEHLHASGLIHMNGRLYDPEIGRMISADPFVPDAMDPQSYNRYSYVRNNPVTRIDPTGFMDVCNTGTFSCTTTTHSPEPLDHWPYGRRTEASHARANQAERIRSSRDFNSSGSRRLTSIASNVYKVENHNSRNNYMVFDASLGRIGFFSGDGGLLLSVAVGVVSGTLDDPGSALPDGPYEFRKMVTGFTDEDFCDGDSCWFQRLYPLFETERGKPEFGNSAFGIHPDGGRPGTAGCCGLTDNAGRTFNILNSLNLDNVTFWVINSDGRY